MDEGLRLARLVSHDRVGCLSPCVPAPPAEAASSAVPKHPTTQAPQQSWVSWGQLGGGGQDGGAQQACWGRGALQGCSQ